MKRRITRSAGFSMMETVALLIILTVAVTALAPTLFRIVSNRKANQTRAEMEAIYRAIAGAPDEGYYGFVGDIGDVPAELSELVEAGNYPLHTLANAAGVGSGWDGPYAAKEKTDLLEDAWGNAYAYGREGREFPGQIRSAGPDGRMDTEDDILYPSVQVPYYGALHIELVNAGEFVLRLYYSDGGRQRYVDKDKPPYIFTRVHYGPHAVQLMQLKEGKQEEYQVLAERVITLSHPKRTVIF